MNKTELADEVAGKVGLTKKEARNVIDTVTSAITDSLARNEKVRLVGFGVFQIMQRKARKGVNPQTGATLQIPEMRVPKFVPGKSLREAVR